MSDLDWIDRWNNGRIAFHEGHPNAHLTAHFSRLEVPKGGRVFVPLCGKTVDIHWLLGRGYRVVGAELSELAIGQLFSELDLLPEVTHLGALKRYSAKAIDIYVGDIFELTEAQLGTVDAVYDRAAFVALPEELRGTYADHVGGLTDGAEQLLVTYGYDQSLMSGPPFSIPDEEVHQRYQARYEITQLAEADAGELRGVAVSESVWLLRPLTD